MNKRYYLSIVFGLMLFLVPFVTAHANILLNIDLDFDQEAKEKIITTAQQYLNTNQLPVILDYDSELIIVKFNEYPLLSVAVNPFDYSVFGTEDKSKVADSGSITTTLEQRKKIAQKIFQSIPKSYQEEMKYGEEREELNLFTHTWYRYKDNLVVPKERLEVSIDGINGEVVRWRLQIFVAPNEHLETTPAIPSKVAEKIAQLRFNAIPIGFTPVLIIHDSKPVWVTKMKVLYPIYIGISAIDGEVLFTGGMKGILPDDYSGGKGVSVIETRFIQEIYEK